MVRFLGAFAMLPTAHFLERIGQLERFLHALRELAGVEPALERGCFLRLVARKARHEIFEVDLVAVEVRPVDARELDLAADLDAAAAAHAGAVDHDRVHAHHGLDAARPRRLGAGFHHHRRTDGDDFFDIRMFLQREVDAVGDEAADAHRAIIGAQNQLLADAFEFVLPEDQVVRTETEHADDARTRLLARSRLRKHRRDAEAAADAQDFFRFPDMARDAHRADERMQMRADLADLLHLLGGLADRLDDEGDGSLGAVKIRERERDALALRVRHDDDELAGPCRLSHPRVTHLEKVGRVGEVISRDDLEGLWLTWLHGLALAGSVGTQGPRLLI